MALQETTLVRDVKAMLIPSGIDVLLAKDNVVRITQNLGGYYTVMGIFGMARISNKDGDALGLAHPTNSVCAEQKKVSEFSTAGAISIDELWNVAKTVFDPEIPVNIVDLGLVYRIEDVGEGKVEVDMTLTAPGCSMGPIIAEDLRVRLEALPSVQQATVNIVWDPPWNRDMMSEEALMVLGLA